MQDDSFLDTHKAADALTDIQSVKEYHALCLAGGCMALGLRYAGTADASAREVVLSTLAYFRSLRCTFEDDDSKTAEPHVDIGCPQSELLQPAIAARITPDRHPVEMCVTSVALALAMLCAGTGDVAAFRIIRELRARADRAVSYGGCFDLFCVKLYDLVVRGAGVPTFWTR